MSSDKRRRLAQRLSKRSPRRGPLESELRDESVAYARERSERGISKNQIARELGVARATVGRWLELPVKGEEPQLRVVEVVDDEAKPDARLESTHGQPVVAINGARVEGLTIAGVIALVRGLR